MIDLTTKANGSGDQAGSWILHTSGVALATGMRVGYGQTTVTGTGVALTETLLWLGATGFGVINYGTPAAGANRHDFISSATAGRTLTLGDGNITIAGGVTIGPFAGSVYPEAVGVLGADVATTSTTAVVLTGVAFTPVASGIYAFEAIILIKTSNTSGLPKISVTGPAETSWTSYEMRTVNTDSGTGAYEYIQEGHAWSVSGTLLTSNNAAIAAANTIYMMRLTGQCAMTSSTPTAAVQVCIQSSSGSYTVTAVKGSHLRARRLL